MNFYSSEQAIAFAFKTRDKSIVSQSNNVYSVKERFRHDEDKLSPYDFHAQSALILNFINRQEVFEILWAYWAYGNSSEKEVSMHTGLAVIEAIKKLTIKNLKVHIYTDSKYVVDAVEKKWVFNWETKGFKGKKNSDLWKSFLKIYPTQKIKFFWVKGHNNHPQNERCDHLAFEASKSKNLDIDHEYEKE